MKKFLTMFKGAMLDGFFSSW